MTTTIIKSSDPIEQLTNRLKKINEDEIYADQLDYLYKLMKIEG